jgi:uncharacterized protein
MIEKLSAVTLADSNRTLDRPTCLALLAGASLGRLVFTDRALPDVLPVHYRMDGDSIVMKLATATAASRGSRGMVVAFTVDEFDATARSGWSVTAVGSADEISDQEARMNAVSAGLTWWWDDGQTALFSIGTEKLTGQRLTAAP